MLLPDSLDGFPPCRMLSTMLDEVCTHFFLPPTLTFFSFFILEASASVGFITSRLSPFWRSPSARSTHQYNYSRATRPPARAPPIALPSTHRTRLLTRDAARQGAPRRIRYARGVLAAHARILAWPIDTVVPCTNVHKAIQRVSCFPQI